MADCLFLGGEKGASYLYGCPLKYRPYATNPQEKWICTLESISKPCLGEAYTHTRLV
jgi:hypothetical protein